MHTLNSTYFEPLSSPSPSSSSPLSRCLLLSRIGVALVSIVLLSLLIALTLTLWPHIVAAAQNASLTLDNTAALTSRARQELLHRL